MRATVVYESMYGNTRRVAEAIAAGINGDVSVVSVTEALANRPANVQLLVIGGPTHAWSMSRPGTRRGAAQAAAKPGSGLTFEGNSGGAGLREFLADSVGNGRSAAAFDTRIRSRFSGRASAAINRALIRHGFTIVAGPESFFVKKDRLVDGELERAREWGRTLAERFGGRPLEDARL